MSKDIKTIVEGCMPDTPRKLMYAGIELDIPQNVKIVLSNHDVHPNRYLLYAKTDDFSSFDILQNPYFECNLNFQDPNKMFSGGWPVLQFESNFRWIFDAQRSLTTLDGRIYIQALFFERNWRGYLDTVPTILKECGEIFGGDKTEDDFYQNPSNAW